MQMLLENRVYGDIAHFLCFLPKEMSSPTPISISCTAHTWILSLAFCSSRYSYINKLSGVHSLFMNVSWIERCPTSWGCCCCALAFLCIRSQTPQGVCSVSLSITTTSSSLSSSLSWGFHLLASQAAFVTGLQTLLHSS